MGHVLSTPASWYIAGPSIGILIVLLLWITNKPFGVLGGYIEAQEWLTGKRSDIGWRAMFVGGVALGGFLYALTTDGWHATLAYGTFDHLVGASLGEKAALLMLAGVLMGAGGRLSGGCTSGHGLCGTAFGSPASFVSLAAFMTTAVACALALAWLMGAPA